MGTSVTMRRAPGVQSVYSRHAQKGQQKRRVADARHPLVQPRQPELATASATLGLVDDVLTLCCRHAAHDEKLS